MCKNLQHKCLCYGDRDDISVQTLFEYSRIFGRQKLVDAHIEINRCFCKHDLNSMTSGVFWCSKDSVQGTVKGKRKKRQTEEEVGRQYQRMDRNGLCQLN